MIICADDYGLDPNINSAILNLAKNHKINATSVLVNKVDNSTAQALLQFKQSLSIGLHLDLFAEAPIKNYLKYLLNPSLLNYEISQQIITFKNLFGFYPNYYDGHMHCHLYPYIQQALISQILEEPQHEFYIRSLTIRDSLQKTNSFFKKIYILLLLSLNKRLLKKIKLAGIKTNAILYGAFNNHIEIKSLYTQFKHESEDNKLFFFHPSLVNINDSVPRKQEYDYIKEI